MGNKHKHLCPCGSGKRASVCCRQVSHTMKLTLTPDTKLEMRRKVAALAEAGKHLEACEILEQLAAVSPHNPLIWNDLGIQYEASGQIDKALHAWRRGYESDSTYPPILYNLGKFTLERFMNLRKTGELTNAETERSLKEAINLLNANLDRDPDNADAHYHLALAYALDQDEQRANAHRTIALRIKQE
jgi:tetratricopeptide (TPR) repeat protein